MNKTLLLFIVDFLFLNLIALTRWEKAAPVRQGPPPVNQVSANAVSKDQDLVEAMRQSLVEEQLSRQAVESQLSSTNSALSSTERNLGEVQGERQKLTAQLVDTQRAQGELNIRYQAQAQQDALDRSRIAQLQREIEDRKAEAERQRASLAALEHQQAEAQKRIEGLAVQVALSQQEKQQLAQEAEGLQTQVQTERAERLKVEQSTTQLAQGVGQLAQNSGDLSREIRENRPINANVLFSDFLSNRVDTTFTVSRKSLFGTSTRTKDLKTVFTTDGKQVYAVSEAEDTAFPLDQIGTDWEKISVRFTKAPDYSSTAPRIEFLSVDPRIVVVPVDPVQVAALGAKVYPIATDTFKFPEAVLISGSGRGYGDVAFKLDDAHRGYVRVNNQFFKRLFGDFAPSRGDFVFSKSGELLGIMVNNTYCALLGDFTPAATLETGDDTVSQHAGGLVDSLSGRIYQMPPELQ